MKCSVTLNFDSTEEAIAFLQSDKAEGASSTTISAEAPKAASRSRAKAKPVAEAPEVHLPPMESNIPAGAFPSAPTTSLSPLPPLAQPAPQAAQSAVFNREIICNNVRLTVGDLKVAGVPEASIMQLFQNVFGKMGQQGKKIDELDDQSLSVFNSLFYPEVQLLRDSLAPKMPNSGNFI